LINHWGKAGQHRNIRLCLVDCFQQLLKDRKNSWGFLWAMRAMERQNHDAGGQLLKGQQGIPLVFLGNRTGGDGRRGLSCDC
jgi:hypothetical protein